MIEEMDNVVWRKTNAALRLALVRGWVPFSNQHIVLNEFPKSGGTWVSEMLAECLEVPFPQHSLPTLKKSILHGHYYTQAPLSNAIILYRDGRDVLNSLYFHSVVGNEFSSDAITRQIRTALAIDNPEDIERFMPRFIEYISGNPVFPRYSWSQFVDRWHGRPGVVETRYEALKSDTARELQRVIAARCAIEIPLDRANQVAENNHITKKNASGNSFRRKGIVGDWRNNFSKEAVEAFKHFNGEALIALGYETDNTW